VFELFSQETHTGAGLGIGLKVVRELVELHGGNVTARSDGAGKGSEFIVRLPVATPAST
jgi:signal transduction histidine kinase